MSQSQIVVGEGQIAFAHAQALAKAANCPHATGITLPCGQCPSCNMFDAGSHTDTFYVTKTNANTIGVGDVRSQIVEPMATKPFGHAYKVFIVDKADTITPAAQSALLKTIEDPAPYGFFLFIAPHTHNFLPTILSRCQVHKLPMHKPHNNTMQAIATSIANQQGLGVLGALALYSKIEAFKEKREDLLEFLDILYNEYGTQLAAEAQAGSVNSHHLHCAACITNTKRILLQNGNTQLALELLLIELCGKEPHLK